MAARIPSHMKITLQKKPDKRASSVDQPGIEPRFSEPKSDVIAFIPLVNGAFFSKAGAKVLLFFDMTKYFELFFEKIVILYSKNKIFLTFRIPNLRYLPKKHYLHDLRRLHIFQRLA